jgi:membrane-bound serine protease (ClpP class)
VILLLEIALLLLGFIFLILEFKLPGHFVALAVALVCFAIFFWLHFNNGGQLVFLAIAFFAIGLVLLGVELFILPGHGVPGVCGILLLLAGLVAASAEHLPETVSDWEVLLEITLRQIMTMVVAGIIAVQVAKYLPEIPYVNRLVLIPPEDKPEVAQHQLPGVEAAESLLGQIGTATSALRPAGIAQFGDRRVDVSAELEMIEPGARIQVIEVEGTRIVVRQV